MNDADIFFGLKPTTEMPPAQPTHFARYPDVQDLCDVFLEEMDWNHDLYTIQQVVAGARDFVLAIGNEPKLLLRATQKMKRKKLSISSPRSCITAAREMRSPEEDTQKYLKGVDDDM